MSHVFTKNFSFITGSIRKKNIIYATMVDKGADEDTHDVSFPILWRDGTWMYDDNYKSVPWSCVATTVAWQPLAQGLFIAAGGEVLCMGSGDIHEETIATGDGSPEEKGPLRGASTVEGIPYVVGMGRQVYRRTARDVWVSADQGTRPIPSESPLVGFDAIDGFSEQELYAAGRFGELWISNGVLWRRIDSPTDAHLTSVCCAFDGKVYVGGVNGVILRGRGDIWEIVNYGPPIDSIWDVEFFDGNLYIVTSDEIFILDQNDDLVSVSMGDDNANTFNHLDSDDGVLWSFGASDVFAYDGNVWARID